MEIETKTFKKMVSKAIKCSSNNNMIPLTQLININYDPNIKQLRLITTDIINYMIVKEDIIDDFDPINVTVKLNLLNKLLSKIKTKTIQLDEIDKELVITGSGISRLEVFVDDNGDPLKFPVRKINKEEIKYDTHYTFNFENILANLSCINEKILSEVNTQFYFEDNLIVTNMDYAACFTTSPDSIENNLLISYKLINLIIASSSNTGQIIMDSKNIKIVMEDMEVIGPVADNSLQYPIVSLLQIKNLPRNNKIVFNKSDMMEIIDRCLVFDNMFETKILNIEINPNCLGFVKVSNNHDQHMSNLELLGSETVYSFVKTENIKLSAESFKSLLSSNPNDTINLCFSEGTKSPVSIDSDGVIQILVRFN